MVNKVIVYTVPLFAATNHLPFVGLLRDQLMCEETKVIGSARSINLPADEIQLVPEHNCSGTKSKSML